MARKKNSTFQGAPMVDVDFDAATFTRVIENAAGDAALIYDIASGQNSEVNTCNHSGGGRGARLGRPWVSQWIGRTVNAGTSPANVPVYLIGVPFFVPAGEAEAIVDIHYTGSLFRECSASIQVLDSSGVFVDGALLTPAEDFFSFAVMRAKLSNLAEGLHLLLLTCDFSDLIGASDFFLASWSVYPGRRRTGVSGTVGRSAENRTGVTDPGTAPVFHRDFDASLFADDEAAHAFLIQGIARNQAGLLEYGTGWPAGDNADYTHVDSGVSNPTRSEFMAHARAGFTAEPEVDFVWTCEAFGAAAVAGDQLVNNALNAGMVDWFAPFPLTAGSLPSNVWRQELTAPDFQTSSSRLKFAVLAAYNSSKLTPGDWTASVLGSSGVFAQVGSSALMMAVATGVAFTAQSVQSVVLSITAGSSPAGPDSAPLMLGWCLYWEP